MKDVRIVIVSWNVEDLLRRCVASLPMACKGIDWECVVVDNASADHSAKVARDAGIRVIQNDSNLGFAKACNIGAQGSDARYLLFLNPDTECPALSLSQFVRTADERPKAGVLGPQLMYPSGKRQPSIRRFPTVWDQTGIVLKLHHLFPKLDLFRCYFAEDVDPTKEQNVDQVMGACFLVRKKAWDQVGGFDERFFIWMEEVDLCRTVKEKGWDVLYVPSITVIHHLGQSFAKEFQVKKQRYFTSSLVSYFGKWHPGIAALLIRLIAPAGVGIVWCADRLRNPYIAWSVFFIALESASAATIFAPIPNTILCLLLGLVAFVAGWKRPMIGLSLLAFELVVGSLGYLLQAGAWPHALSLRIVLTVSFLLGWAIGVRSRVRIPTYIRLFEGREGYLILLALIVFAYFRGIFIGNVFALQDANAWADWFLLFPVLDVASQEAGRIRKDIVPPLVVGVAGLGLKVLGLEYLFSHGISFGQGIYLWVRRTGVGEVTDVIGDTYRVFLQSQIFAVPAWLFACSWWLIGRKESNVQRPTSNVGDTAWWMMAVCTATLGISLSRSFWVGALDGAVVLLAYVIRRGSFAWKKLIGIATAKAMGIFLICAVLLFPIPRIPDVHLLDLFGSRANAGEAAAASRSRLLPVLWHKILEHPVLGSGFGATVTYQSLDPRILQDHPDGMYTTYAFEWGWLEHWVKLGILGIPVMLYLLWSMGRRIWLLNEPEWLRIGAVASIFSLAAIHVFTPYLNHPLGFLFFFVGEGLILSSQRKNV